MTDLKDVELKCFLCGAWIGLRESKSGKPHGFCVGCGLQVFLRRQESVDIVKIALKEKKADIVRRRQE